MLAGNERFYAGGSGPSTITGSTGDDTIFADPLAAPGGPVAFELLSYGFGVGGAKVPADDMVAAGSVFRLPSGAAGIFLVSCATNLIRDQTIPKGSPCDRQVYLRDLATGDTRLVSANSAGTRGGPATGSVSSSDSSWEAVISPDGRYVALRTSADTLTGALDAPDQVALKDLVTGALHIVSRKIPTGFLSSGPCHSQPVFSPDGRKLAFTCTQPLLPGVAGQQVYVADLTTPATAWTTLTVASASPDGATGNGPSYQPDFSPDGKRIAFWSRDANLLAADSAIDADIYVKTLGPAAAGGYGQVGELEIASTKADGSMPASDCDSTRPAFSPDGIHVAFGSKCEDLVPSEDATVQYDIFEKTLLDAPNDPKGSIRLVSRSAAGAQGQTEAYGSVYSPDASRLAYVSSDATPAGATLADDVQVMAKHLLRPDPGPGELNIITVTAVAGLTPVGNLSRAVGFAPDGSGIVISSFASDLPGDDDGTGKDDAFLAILPPDPGGNDVIAGGAGNDRLVGGPGNDRLDGGSGADRLEGGPGDDLFLIDNAGDVVIESAGQGMDAIRSTVKYSLPADVERLALAGTAAIDGTGNDLPNLLVGNSAANRLSGGAGDDVLVGGGGRDRLTGGAGKDVFRVERTSHSRPGKTRRDLVLDFQPDQGDRIDLRTIDAKTDVKGNQAFTYIGRKPFDGRKGLLRWTGAVLQGDVDGDRVAEVEIEVKLKSGAMGKAALIR